MSRRLSVKKIMIVSLSVVMLVLCVLFLAAKGKLTAYDYLKKSNRDNLITPSELLCQETLDTGFDVVFYIDRRGLYNCAVIKKELFNYRTVGVSGSLGIDDTGQYLYSSFADGRTKQNICWGVLTDNDVTTVFLDDEPCNIADTTYSFRIFWLMGLDNENPSLTTNP